MYLCYVSTYYQRKPEDSAVPAIKKTVAKNQKAKKTVSVKSVKSVKKVTKAPAAAKPSKAVEKLVTIDRRTTHPDRRAKSGPAVAERHPLERRAKVNRRRQIDPTTCERDYTLEEIEFMKALDDYKRANGRMFPTCSEVLEVIHKLGYEKRPVAMPLEIGEMMSAESSSSATSVPDFCSIS
jgi:hypothetical protein